MPTTVFPFEPMNSIGAYVASAATTSEPFLRILEGTSLAMLGTFLTCVLRAVAPDAPAKPPATRASAAAARHSRATRRDIPLPPIHDH